MPQNTLICCVGTVGHIRRWTYLQRRVWLKRVGLGLISPGLSAIKSFIFLKFWHSWSEREQMGSLTFYTCMACRRIFLPKKDQKVIKHDTLWSQLAGILTQFEMDFFVFTDWSQCPPEGSLGGACSSGQASPGERSSCWSPRWSGKFESFIRTARFKKF